MQVKKCKYFDKGFCKSQHFCKCYHPEKVCDQLNTEGTCRKLNCRDRHPRECRYWKYGDCWRKDDCLYGHTAIDNNKVEAMQIDDVICDRCHNATEIRYYCDVCGNNCCPHCTLKEAHSESFFRVNEGILSC